VPPTQLRNTATPDVKPGRVIPILLGTTALGTLLATVRYGIGLTPDSVVYVTGARSFADGHGYTRAGTAITDFPPAYSATLSLAERIGIDAIDAARVLSVVAFMATVLLAYVLLGRHVRSQRVRLAATVVISCSAVLLDVYEKALSEHLFLPVLLGFALLIEDLARRPRSVAVFAAAVGLVWVAFYLRYIGVVLVAVGAIVILAAEWRRSRVSAILRGGAFAAIALSAPVLWMIRNVDAGSDPFGHRASASVSVFTNVSRIAKQVSTWLLTDEGPSAVRVLLLIAALCVAGVLAVRLRLDGARLPADWHSMLPLTLLVVVYVVYLAGSASVVAFGAISNTRFMVPVFVPTVVIGAWMFEHVRQRVGREDVRRAITVVAAAWVVLNVVWFAARAVRSAQDGAGGYASARYHNSEILKDVKRLDSSIPAFSNDAPAVSLFGARDVRPSVAKTYFQSDDQTGRIGEFVRFVGCRARVQLIWFLPNPRPYLYTPTQLSQRVRLNVVVKRADGVIYDVRPRSSAASAFSVAQCARA
jgi:hypothetical protein